MNPNVKPNMNKQVFKHTVHLWFKQSTHISGALWWEDGRAGGLKPVRRVSVRGRSLSSKHATQHCQSLDVTYVAVVIQTVESMKSSHVSQSRDSAPPEEGGGVRHSQGLQQVAPKRVSGPGGLCVWV